jgi:hypothetical protein
MDARHKAGHDAECVALLTVRPTPLRFSAHSRESGNPERGHAL